MYKRQVRESVQVGGGVFVELKLAREGVDHLRGGVMVAALFEPQVVVRADAGERRQLLTAQPRNASAPEFGQPLSLIHI